MMRTKMIQSIAVIGMLAIAIAGCKSTKKSDTTTENVMVSAVSKPVGKDTITINSIRRVQRDSLGLFAVVFDVPTSGSDIMKNAITEWIRHARSATICSKKGRGGSLYSSGFLISGRIFMPRPPSSSRHPSSP